MNLTLRAEGLSGAILAGGRSSRMAGKDKAFLTLNGVPFITRISEEMARVCNGLFVVIGKKEEKKFEDVLSGKVAVVKDRYDYGNPVSGMLTACELAKHPYVAIVACDMPLLRSEVIAQLYEQALGHSAAVPVWEEGHRDPLCAVYNAIQFREATLKINGTNGCGGVLSKLDDLILVPVSDLRKVDPELESLRNINSMKDYEALSSRR